MVKKIFTYSLIILLLAMAGGYFFVAGRMVAAKEPAEVCKRIKINILDSAENKFVSRKEVISIIDGYNGKCIGKKCSELNLNDIETLLDKRSAIKKSQVSITNNGLLNIDITQRRPILRIETSNGGFYIDGDEYIFPLAESFTSYVPIVTGNIPLELYDGFRGSVDKEGRAWLSRIIDFGRYLNANPFWNAMINQIYVERNGDIILSAKVGDIKIIFGEPDDIEYKFRKLMAFYKNIAPEKGWNRYSEVNVKYKKQIVCKRNEKSDSSNRPGDN